MRIKNCSLCVSGIAESRRRDRRICTGSVRRPSSRRRSARRMHQHLTHEIQVLELRSKIASDAQSEMTKEQREYVLRQQLRAIQEELAGGGDKGEVGSLRDQLAKAELPEDVRKEVERELNKLERIPPASPDYGVTRSYLEFVLELPWNKGSEHALDIAETRRVLDED